MCQPWSTCLGPRTPNRAGSAWRSDTCVTHSALLEQLPGCGDHAPPALQVRLDGLEICWSSANSHTGVVHDEAGRWFRGVWFSARHASKLWRIVEPASGESERDKVSCGAELYKSTPVAGRTRSCAPPPAAHPCALVAQARDTPSLMASGRLATLVTDDDGASELE